MFIQRLPKFIIALLFGLSLNVQADEDYDAGKEIYEFRCADTCHQTPTAKGFKPKQWRIILKNMQKRMETAGMTPLTEQELEQVFYYLTVDQ